MEMELNKQKFDFYDSEYESSVIHEESGEIIIPDTSPDMVRIISSKGRAFVKEKVVNDGSITVSGNLVGSVLYVAEGDKNVRKLDVNMPFSHKFESNNITNNSICIAISDLINLETREINSRKIALRAHIAIEMKCYQRKSIEITTDVLNKEKFAVELKNCDVDLYVPTFIKERSFAIVDDLEISSSSPMMETMLDEEVELVCNDMKVIGNKAIIKGMAGIKYTYASKDGNVNVAAYNLPYSQIIDLDDFEDDCDLRARMSVRALNIEPAHDMTGDTRYISVNILVDTVLIAYSKDKVTMVDDLYSTSHVINAQFEELPVSKIKEKINRRISVNESIETANPVRRIIDTRITLEPLRVSENKIKNDAIIQIVYISDNDDIYCAHKKCGVECYIEAITGKKVLCDAAVTGVNANGSGNQIAVNFFVEYDVNILNNDKVGNLKSLACGEEKCGKDDEATVIIKHIYSEQPLWNIAKKYNTTVGEIAAANSLDFAETVAAGSMLLIPCGK